MRVLIVDDDDNYRQLLRMILVNKHHAVIEARDGVSAWRLMQEDPTPFVIADWMLPYMDGLELVRRIRKAEFPTYTYIILLTARSSKGDVVNGLEAGADDYLTKPFDLSELGARITIGERIIDLETRLREAMDQLFVLATHDSLTGLLNRRALYECASKEMARSLRESQPISLVMVDIDFFKRINDQYGHLIGDKALCELAELLSRNKRPYDHSGRWGGEEFLIILPNTGLVEATQVAERLRQTLSEHPLILPDGKSIYMRASFGVASSNPAGEMSFETLVQHADKALYQAKRQGRNRVCAYEEDPDVTKD